MLQEENSDLFYSDTADTIYFQELKEAIKAAKQLCLEELPDVIKSGRKSEASEREKQKRVLEDALGLCALENALIEHIFEFSESRKDSKKHGIISTLLMEKFINSRVINISKRVSRILEIYKANIGMNAVDIYGEMVDDFIPYLTGKVTEDFKPRHRTTIADSVREIYNSNIFRDHANDEILCRIVSVQTPTYIDSQARRLAKVTGFHMNKKN